MGVPFTIHAKKETWTMAPKHLDSIEPVIAMASRGHHVLCMTGLHGLLNPDPLSHADSVELQKAHIEAHAGCADSTEIVEA